MRNPTLGKGRFERGFSGSHLGVDYSSYQDILIYPAWDGVVTHYNNDCPEIGFYGSNCGGGGGNWLEITHPNGLKTRYLHFKKIFVRLGQKVNINQAIGIMGTSGSSTGRHLHFEILKNGVRIDPLPYLKYSSSVLGANSTNNLKFALLIFALVFAFKDELDLNL